jgi:hypothetical protein
MLFVVERFVLKVRFKRGQQMPEGWEYDGEEWRRINSGLALLGWRFIENVTNEDSFALIRIADEALSLSDTDSLFDVKIEVLAYEAYRVLNLYVMEAGERAMMLTGPYTESKYLPQVVSLIDEGALAYYRGYYTASFSVLLIALERYLRLVLEDTQTGASTTFAALRESISCFQPSKYRDYAELVLKGLYGRYDSASPTRFYFNRHGLLHGIREPLEIDQMNSSRMFLLFDLLLGAEIGRIPRYMVDRKAFDRRHEAFSACSISKSEAKLLAKQYQA